MYVCKRFARAVVLTEDSAQPKPEDSGSDGTQIEDSSESEGTLIVAHLPSALKEYQVPDVLAGLQASHPRLFGGEIPAALMHTLQSILAERSEQREIEVREARQENRHLTEELTTARVENSVLREREKQLGEKTLLTDVIIAAGGILLTAGLSWAWSNRASFAPWGIGLTGLVLLGLGFYLSQRKRGP